MNDKKSAWKDKLSQISAKTLNLGGQQAVRGRNERKIRYSEPFKYTPLSGPKCFRLLKIHPGVDTDVISVEMYEADLDKRPTFHALSYTWNLNSKYDAFNGFDEIEDDGKEERPILCNGDTFHITMNLYQAFLEFRRRKLETSIWADQICINQQDGEEKIAQLAIMEKLYRSAETVEIWLGTLSPIRKWGLDFMETLPDQPNRTASSSLHSTTEEADPPLQRSLLEKFSRPFTAAMEISKSLGLHAHWLAVLLILARNWFGRIWTLQEFLLAKRFRMLMGSRDIPPSAIVRSASQLLDFYASDTLSVHLGLNVSANMDLKVLLQYLASMFAKREDFRSSGPYNAAEYLDLITLREATVPKDFVFAGAALLKQGAPQSVNYFSTTRDVFMAFAAERLWPQIGIDSLSLVGGASPKIEGLPSWTPDLSIELRPLPLRQCGCHTSRLEAPEEVSFRISGQTLLVKAAKWDSVKQIGESIWSWTEYTLKPYNRNTESKVPRPLMKTSTLASEERFGLMLDLLKPLGSFYAPTGERTIDALWHTLLGGATLADEVDISVWQDRFYHFFALTYLDIRNTLGLRKRSKSLPSPWIVPLVQDLPRLEERVSQLLETFDRSTDGSEQPLKKVMSEVAKRLYAWDMDGETNIEDTASFGELKAMFRGDPSHEPAGMFGTLFATVYDGRRIFSTENGYLGISTEAINTGDEIFFVAGADILYVFRPVEGHDDATYTLVGEAYLHGMDNDHFTDAELNFKDLRIL